MRVFAITLSMFVAACATQPAAVFPPPPATEQRPVTETLHGQTFTDPYRWLEDQQSPETRAWIDKQNAYTDEILKNLPARQQFADRLYALQNTEQLYQTPRYRGGRYFYLRRAVGQDLYALYMR